MSKHTPGPWKVMPAWQYGDLMVVREKPWTATYEFAVAYFGDTMAKGEERLSNARLIAAAPEMFACLESIQATLFGKQDPTPLDQTLIREIQAVLSKAKKE